MPHDTTEEKVWKAVPGWSEYEVCEDGQVRSAQRPTTDGRLFPQRILTVRHNTKGYPRVDLRQDGVRKSFLVSTLVRLAFKPHTTK